MHDLGTLTNSGFSQIPPRRVQLPHRLGIRRNRIRGGFANRVPSRPALSATLRANRSFACAAYHASTSRRTRPDSPFRAVSTQMNLPFSFTVSPGLSATFSLY
jgi:hypothetical protein